MMMNLMTMCPRQNRLCRNPSYQETRSRGDREIPRCGRKLYGLLTIPEKHRSCLNVCRTQIRAPPPE